MNRFLSDVKKILLGQDGSEQMPLDFKEQITVSINNKIIDKAVASLLLATRNSVDKFGNEIDKKQIADVSGKGTRVGKENAVRQAEKEIKDEKIEKSNKEKEEKKKKEESLRQTMQRIAEQEEKEDNKINYRQKRRLDIYGRFLIDLFLF